MWAKCCKVGLARLGDLMIDSRTGHWSISPSTESRQSCGKFEAYILSGERRSYMMIQTKNELDKRQTKPSPRSTTKNDQIESLYCLVK